MRHAEEMQELSRALQTIAFFDAEPFGMGEPSFALGGTGRDKMSTMARSPWSDVRLSPSTAMPSGFCVSAPAQSQKAALDQSPST